MKNQTIHIEGQSASKRQRTVDGSCCSVERSKGSVRGSLPFNDRGSPEFNPQTCWNGTIEVSDILRHFHKGILSRLPCVVSPKVYEISRSLPKTLNFEIFPRRDIWPKIFQLDPPTKDDIGLYFFPCELERNKERYIRLLERLNSQDLAMKGCINNVQLLLFTSNELPIDSRRLEGEIYLWGVFHRMKHKQPGGHTAVHVSSYSSTSAGPIRKKEEKHKISGHTAVRVPLYSSTLADPVRTKEKNHKKLSRHTVAQVPGFTNLGPPGFHKHLDSSIGVTCKDLIPSRMRGRDLLSGTSEGYTSTAPKVGEVKSKFHQMKGSTLEKGFTLEIHHGGSVDSENVSYLGGSVHMVYNVDDDLMSIFEFAGIVRELGYSPNFRLLAVYPDGLRVIAGDTAVLILFGDHQASRKIVIFIEHLDEPVVTSVVDRILPSYFKCR